MKRLMMITLLILLTVSTAAAEQPRLQGKYIYSDGTDFFRSPSSPEVGEPVLIRVQVRTGMADEVLLHLPERAPIRMAPQSEEGIFTIYAAETPPIMEQTSYYFQVTQGDKQLFYSRRGVEAGTPPTGVQFRIQPGFTIPGWMEGAVLYQVFTDRFSNGDPTNDVRTNEYLYDNYPAVAKEWETLPDSSRTYADGSDRTREFYGGDIQGLIDKLDYLQGLGIEGIYLNPVFVSPSNHKYDTQDYYHIDPHFGVIVHDDDSLIVPGEDPNYGSPKFDSASAVNRDAAGYITRTTDEANLAASDALFKQFVDEAHARGIRVILDGVFNHAGSFNRWFDREHLYPSDGAYESAGSLWDDWFIFHDPDGFPDNESYEAWYGFKTLPKINIYDGSPAEQAILDIAAYWVGPEIGVDGWRLDVAAEVGTTAEYNHTFWERFRQAVKKANPDAVILAEVYGDSSPWLEGDEWDTIMNYDAFFDPVSYFLTGMEKHSWSESIELLDNTDTFSSTLADRMARLPWPSLSSAMNELSNHDHSRFYTRTGRYVDVTKASQDIPDPALADDGLDEGILKEAVLMQMFMPGAPTIYYGEEAGLAGFTDPDSRRTYPWGSEDESILSFYHDVISLRAQFSCVRDGSFMILPTGRKGVFAFSRWDDADQVVVVTNNREEMVLLTIPVDLAGIDERAPMEVILSTTAEDHSTQVVPVTPATGGLQLELPPHGGMVIQASRETVREREVSRPKVTGFSIPNDEVRGSVTIHFDRLMDPRMIIDAFSMSPRRNGRFYWNGYSVTFIPSAAVFPGEYTITIDDTIRSVEGNLSLEAPVSWRFTVH